MALSRGIFQALMNHWYDFYERSLGCLGVLKDWLVRTLSAMLYSGATTLTLERVPAHALSTAQCERMASDATAAEHRLHDTESSRAHLWSLLGMQELPHEQGAHALQEPEPPPTVPSTRRPQRPRVPVGHRAPRRDPVGPSPQSPPPEEMSLGRGSGAVSRTAASGGGGETAVPGV
jgi:hypothetical protein